MKFSTGISVILRRLLAIVVLANLVSSQGALSCKKLLTQERCESPPTPPGNGNGQAPPKENGLECVWCANSDKCVDATADGEPCAERDIFDTTKCPQVKDEAGCMTAADCTWCENACRSSDSPCAGNNGGGDVGTNNNKPEDCNQLLMENNCTSVGTCKWCSENEKCLPADRNCPGEGGNGGGNGGENGGGNGNKPEDCNQWMMESNCTSVGTCKWCSENEKCLPADRNCPGEGGNGGGNGGENGGGNGNKPEDCNQLQMESNCTSVGTCKWCSENEKCLPSDRNCPGEGGNGGGNGGGNNAGNDDKCNSIRQNAECLAKDCFWCSGAKKCRAQFAKCPGNDKLPNRPNVCAKIRNETECMETVLDGDSGDKTCVWCADKKLCRAEDSECPGQGRGNPCRGFDSPDTCTSVNATSAGDVTCAWHDMSEKCTPVRGLSDDSEEPTALACPALTSLDNCTASYACRWCPEEEKCRKASQPCPNGGAGQRGNPCPEQDSEELCTGTDGCLWCQSGSKCKKATHTNVCQEDDDDALKGNSTVCRSQDT